MRKTADEHHEEARTICDCSDCGGKMSQRPGPDCLRHVISEALIVAAEDAIDGQPRTPEWRATYNAAITGMMAEGDITIPTCHSWATKVANASFLEE